MSRKGIVQEIVFVNVPETDFLAFRDALDEFERCILTGRIDNPFVLDSLTEDTKCQEKA